MIYPLLKQLPNILTTLRLFLAAPICLFILEGNYKGVLWIAFIAGISDGLDGWLARRLDAQSRYGSIFDPLADKAMLTGAYVCFVVVNLLPWWVAAIVVIRDIVIVGGAIAYHWLMGHYELAPSFWGKASTFVQITYVLMLLAQQIKPTFPLLFLQVGLWLLVALAFISGWHYCYVWGSRALAQRK